MKKRNLSILAVACLALATTLPARASVGGVGEKVAESLGLRYDRPVGVMKIGQTHPATILNASRIGRHGVSARSNDKVVLTLTGDHTFSLFHTGTGKTLNFRWDEKGRTTPIR